LGSYIKINSDLSCIIQSSMGFASPNYYIDKYKYIELLIGIRYSFQKEKK